ncbi:putative ABC-type transporter [Salmonella enterica subsp. enterica serovar 4 [Salmonella enterica subsp. enterica serovar 4 [Salmonella enterica subsp. enterica serovar 4,[5],12:i:- str. CVM23701]|nr:putative ABC-type transporter [Salmonella enterica subsp. enterica serovar Saintpaul str. SARA23]EDZ03999.1 putative ABC-type transporter [Salmonella enterica subsp. enterica serovar Virchow str. SL491]EDZ15512.1 putative ABC-type transporter [Salmonella enterica subsp. enterica serovar 4 [Salmonella enterica subsp. enterica serovar 4 [Salmonella enterica subsp. enterica serovar 4,[5],12:i:- str. CVM23701]
MYILFINRRMKTMPQIAIESNERLSLRVSTDAKKLIVRAAAIQQTNLTDFVVSNILPVAQKIVDAAERVYLTERDTKMIMEILDNPPAPNEKLLAAAFALPDMKK